MLRNAAAIIAVLISGSVHAAPTTQADRVAVIIGVGQPVAAVPALETAEQDALKLADSLLGDAGYASVSTLIGSEATSETITRTLKAAVETTADDGTLLVVYVGHGAGGDYGEPALLSTGASTANLVETGLSIEAFAAAVRPRTPEQSVVVILDASHAGGIDGVALIGPSALDWPLIPDWGLAVTTKAVTTKATGTFGPPGVLVPAFHDGLAGAADHNHDGHVTISELSSFVDARVGTVDGLRLDRNGAVAANLVVSSATQAQPEPTVVVPAPGPAPTPTPRPESQADSVFELKPVAVTVAAVGAGAAVASLVMYFAKLNGCEDIDGKTTCGDDAGYRSFRTTQYTLGIVGGGLVLTGVGLQFVPGPNGATVGVVGTF
jgi:hypothetical protein